MIIGMMLETLGIGIIIPVITLISDENVVINYPRFKPLFQLLGEPNQAKLIVEVMLVLVTIYLVKAFFLGFLYSRQMRFAFGLQVNISQRIFTNYLRQTYTFHLQRNSAQLINIITGEVSQFTFGATLPSLALITESLVFMGLSLVLLISEPVGTTIIVAVLGIIAIIFQRSTKHRLIKWGTSRQFHEALRLQHLQQGLGSVKDIKLYGREENFANLYFHHSNLSAHFLQKQLTLQQLPRLWIELLAVSGLASLVLTIVIQGKSFDTIAPVLGLFAAASFRLIPSVNRILVAVQSLKFCDPTIEILRKELNLPSPTPYTSGTDLPSETTWTNINVCNIRFAYPDSTSNALNHVSLVIQKGDTVGFIGSSGSGKSTLIDVILGLLVPNMGHILISEYDIHENIRWWQNQIGYVPQTIYLTDDTLRRNVAFGLSNEQIDEDAIDRAIKSAQLEEFVDSLPLGLETFIGERGIRLSGGQRQRIGIARALYSDPPVLVLDEATSSLDTITEKGIMNAISALRGSKTILIVAHRLSTVESCDHIYQMDHGRIFEKN